MEDFAFDYVLESLATVQDCSAYSSSNSFYFEYIYFPSIITAGKRLLYVKEFSKDGSEINVKVYNWEDWPDYCLSHIVTKADGMQLRPLKIAKNDWDKFLVEKIIEENPCKSANSYSLEYEWARCCLRLGDIPKMAGLGLFAVDAYDTDLYYTHGFLEYIKDALIDDEYDSEMRIKVVSKLTKHFENELLSLVNMPRNIRRDSRGKMLTQPKNMIFSRDIYLGENPDEGGIDF